MKLKYIENKIYLIIVFVVLALLFYSVIEINPVIVDIDSYGLASYLTITYWTGYVLLSLSSIMLYHEKRLRNDVVYLIYLIVTGLFLFGVSIFAEENGRNVWAYYPTGEITTILDDQKIDNMDEYPLISYRSWPGSHFVSAYMIYIANVGIHDLIKYMPLAWTIILIFIMYGVGRTFKLPANQCFMITFLLLSSFWIMNYYYGPQSVAYILYLVFFISMINLYKDKGQTTRRETIAFTILTLLIFIATVMTHMLTSMLLIATLLFSSRFLIPYKIKPKDFLYRNGIKFVILFTVIFIGWHIYIAPLMFNTGVRDLIEQILEGQLFSVFTSEKYSSGTMLIRQIIHYSRIVYLVTFAICMMMAAIFYLRNKIEDKYKYHVKICFLWFIGISTLLVFRYGAEMDDRVYMFSLLPMILIIIMTFDRKIITVLSILFLVFHIPAHYGTESYDMVYTTELKGSKFMASNMNPYGSINYYNSRLVIYYNPGLITDIRGSGYKEGYYNPDDESLESSYYILHSRQISNYLVYFFGVDKIQNWLNKDNRLNLLYNNGYYSVYQNNYI